MRNDDEMKANVPLMRRYLALVLLLAACGSDKPSAKLVETPTTTAPATTTVRATTPVASAAIVLKADGQQDTPPFHLDSGRYRSRWQSFDDCEYFGDLKPGTFSYVLRASSATSGETYINGVKAGEYYIHMNTGPTPKCRWSITLERA